MNRQPELIGKLLHLRPLKESDFEELYSIASDPLLWEQHPVPNRHQREVYAPLFKDFIDTQGTLVILDAQTQQVIGSSRYYDPSDDAVAIGYTMLARKYWGGVYNRELKTLMLDHAFKSVKTVIFHVGEGNIRSQRALEKIGAHKIDRSIRTLPDGRQVSQLHYKIDKGDWL